MSILSVPVVKSKTAVKLEIFAPDGELTSKIYEPAHSWTRNAYNSFGAYLLGTGMGSTYADGALVGWGSNNLVIDVSWLYGGAIYHIAVGTSDVAFSVNQYNLLSSCAHGYGYNQFIYQAVVNEGLAYVSETKTYTQTYSRYLNNNSGNSIVVKELGIFTYGYAYFPMLARDVLGTAATILDAGQLKVTYAISTVVNPV